MVVRIKYREGGFGPAIISGVTAVDFEEPDVLMVYCGDGPGEFVRRLNVREIKYFSVEVGRAQT